MVAIAVTPLNYGRLNILFYQIYNWNTAIKTKLILQSIDKYIVINIIIFYRKCFLFEIHLIYLYKGIYLKKKTIRSF